MKLRLYFISNSSSSSYIIKKEGLNEEQIEMIKNHLDVCNKLMYSESERVYSDDDPYGEENWDENDTDLFGTKIRNLMYGIEPYDSWDVEEKENTIEVYTIMDNFDMGWFLSNVVEVDDEYISHRY
jgi:hypothetical protein